MAAKTAPAPWRSRIVGTGTEAPDQLVANPRNWRTHPGPQRDALRGSLDSVGWVQQVMVNRVTGHVVDGHARVEEALSRGEPTVPVLYVELTEEEEALVLATLDPIGAMAATDADRLTALLAEVGDHDAGLDALLASLAPEMPIVGLTDPDAVPDVADDGGVKRGDIYVLGDHRLMCGDATDGGDVALLLDGAVPILMTTDPPYGVALDQGWRDRIGINGMGKAQSDHLVGDDAHSWAASYTLSQATIAFVWHASLYGGDVARELEESGFEVKQQIVWVKNMAPLSRSYYHWKHEACWFAVRKGATVPWYVGRDETTVWEAASPKHIMAGSDEPKMDHPSQKPVTLSERPIANHTRMGDVVYDPFVGSGTTLIAAEKTGRRCYAMEIEPRYVAVAIRRWEAFTGRNAEKVA